MNFQNNNIFNVLLAIWAVMMIALSVHAQEPAKTNMELVEGITDTHKIILAGSFDVDHPTFIKAVYTDRHNKLLVRHQICNGPAFTGMCDPTFELFSFTNYEKNPTNDDAYILELIAGDRLEYLMDLDHVTTFEKFLFPKGHNSAVNPYKSKTNTKVPCNPLDGTGCDGEKTTPTFSTERE